MKTQKYLLHEVLPLQLLFYYYYYYYHYYIWYYYKYYNNTIQYNTKHLQ